MEGLLIVNVSSLQSFDLTVFYQSHACGIAVIWGRGVDDCFTLIFWHTSQNGGNARLIQTGRRIVSRKIALQMILIFE